MKNLFVILLFIVFAIPNPAQSKDLSVLKKEIKSFKDNRYYLTEYNKEMDRTLISFSSKLNKGIASFDADSALHLSVHFILDGQILEQTIDEFVLKFKIKYRVENNTPVFILADDDHFELKEEDIGNTKLRIFGMSAPNAGLFSFLIDRENMVKIAKAKTIIIKVGNVQFTLKPEDQKVLKDILTISEVK